MTVTAVAGRGGPASPPVDASPEEGPGAVARVLSVAEIQQALRELRSRRPAAVAPAGPLLNVGPDEPAAATTRGLRSQGRRAEVDGIGVRDLASAGGDTVTRDTPGRGDTVPERLTARGDTDAADIHSGRLSVAAGARRVVVVGAHSGAGASTVALAIADAAGSTDRPVHLVEAAPDGRCGLDAAAVAELGADTTGAWRRGSRKGVTIDRRADHGDTVAWPAPPVGGAELTVLDLGMPSPAQLKDLIADRGTVVVVCRVTVPGVRRAEQLLTTIARAAIPGNSDAGNADAGPVVVVATLGPARWPGQVTASAGPRLVALQSAGRVVTVPADRRLQVSGPTSDDLPTPLVRAGLRLLRLADAADPVGEGRGAGASAATSCASSSSVRSGSSWLSRWRLIGARR